MAPFLVFFLAGIIAIQRVIELRLAACNQAWALASGAREFGAGHYPLFILLHTGWMVGWIIEALAQGPSLSKVLARVARLVCSRPGAAILGYHELRPIPESNHFCCAGPSGGQAGAVSLHSLPQLRGRRPGIGHYAANFWRVDHSARGQSSECGSAAWGTYSG